LNVNITFTEDENNVQYRVYMPEASSDGTCQATIKVHDSTEKGIARVTAFTSSTKVTATVLTDFASTNASYRWAEGAWSNSEGWPSAFTFFEERACYAGTIGQPQTIWLSATDDYEKFDDIKTPDAAFWLTIGADKRNGIRWLSGLEALCIGTNGGEWRMRATSLEERLTWENFDLKQQSSYGSKRIQPLAVGTAVLFVDTVGRKIREMIFKDSDQKFVAPDLVALAEHITLGGITSIAFQKNPDFMLWATLAGGTLLSMAYERDQNVVAWASHPLGGTSASCDSVSVIPGTNEDEVWICVAKTVDGSTVRHIEQFQPRVDVDEEDSWFAKQVGDGDHVYIAVVGGMTELNGNYYTADDTSTTAIALRTYEKYT
jgi:hypothetical protein